MMDKEGRQLVHVHQQLWWAEQSLAHSVCSQDKARGGPSTETSATLRTGCLSLHHVSLRRKELPKGRLPVSPPQPDRTGFAEPTLPPLRYAECIVPKTHFCEGQTFPTGWRETCKLPLALLSAVTGLGCTWSLWHQSPVAEHLCCFQEQPAGKCQLTCRSGAGWRCHVSSNALRGTAALREITPAHQIGDITLWTLTILSFVTEDLYNQLPLPAVFGNNKTL